MQIVLQRRKDSPSYNSWHNARQRCNDPRSKDYPRYGAKGIKVCKRWDDFMLFLEDMGEKPSPIHSLDRKNNNGNYSPENCRWATPQEQTHNSNVCKLNVLKVSEIRKKYSIGGITQAQLSRQYGISQSVISRVISKRIWKV